MNYCDLDSKYTLNGLVGNIILIKQSLARYDRLRREELEMKKSIAVILLGSALLLPNNNSVEASYSDNNVQVQKVRYVEHVGEGEMFNFYKLKAQRNAQFGSCVELEQYANEMLQKLMVQYKPSIQQPAKPVEKPTQPAPEKPAETPTPVQPAPEKPAETPTPVQPAPQKPVETPTPVTPVQTPDASISAVEQEVVNLTNAERKKAGLAPFQTDSKLMDSARAKSTDMATKKYFSHTSPTYGSPFDQMKQFGITYKSAGENIASGQRSAEEVVKAWMDSPGHRANILNASFTHIGVGFDKNGNYWTQQFIGK